jgi:dTDP-4-amino-4,6-dideoxygalactose transaminase
MRIGRTLPPAATPIGIRDIASGICGIVAGQQELDRFQGELKEHFGVKHCFLVSSGKAALTLILLALKELSPDRDEVLIPAFTCYSVPSSIVRAGLRIRLCDLHPDCLDFDFVQLSAMLSEALPLHTYADSAGDAE